MSKVGDPTPTAPVLVLKDKGYKLVDVQHQASQIIRLTVLHCGTETYWQTFYAAYADWHPATWHEVRPKRITIVDYEGIT